MTWGEENYHRDLEKLLECQISDFLLFTNIKETTFGIKINYIKSVMSIELISNKLWQGDRFQSSYFVGIAVVPKHSRWESIPTSM